MRDITPAETREYYDQNVDVYDRKTGFGLGGGQEYNFARYYEPFLEREVPSSGRVLELGCGTGFYTRWLADRGLAVYAMDISASMVERARQRCPSGVSFFVGNCEDPASVMDEETIGDGFQAIVGVNTFSYYPNKVEALGNYRRLLADGARLIMLDMNGWSLTQQIAYLFDYRGARRFAKNVYQSTPRKLSSMLEGTGFRVEFMKRFTFVPNETSATGAAAFAVVDKLLARVPHADFFALRVGWVARKA